MKREQLRKPDERAQARCAGRCIEAGCFESFRKDICS
jgi:hypothetical protein